MGKTEAFATGAAVGATVGTLALARYNSQRNRAHEEEEYAPRQSSYTRPRAHRQHDSHDRGGHRCRERSLSFSPGRQRDPSDSLP